MKQKDVALIILIAGISATVSYFMSTKLFVTPANRQQKVEVVDKISADFGQPDPRYFNKDSIDATPTTQLGPGSNQNPFTKDNR
jgi:hypothetical protein